MIIERDNLEIEVVNGFQVEWKMFGFLEWKIFIKSNNNLKLFFELCGFMIRRVLKL